MKISSQKFLDQNVVDEKIAAEDYTVLLATIIIDGNEVEVVIDGHHSLAAAKQAGVEPDYQYAVYNYQREVECIGLDSWLEQHWIDCPYYDIETGTEIF